MGLILILVGTILIFLGVFVLAPTVRNPNKQEELKAFRFLTIGSATNTLGNIVVAITATGGSVIFFTIMAVVWAGLTYHHYTQLKKRMSQ